MIDINELRRLAQAATPGPWINHGRQPNVAGLPHSAVAAKTLLARVYSETYGDVEQETANASFIAAANPAAISELLDRLEATEKDRSNFLLEMGKLCAQCDALRLRIEAAEKERDNANAAAVGIALQAEGLRCEIDNLRAELDKGILLETGMMKHRVDSAGVVTARKHSHYFKDVLHLKDIDVYRVLKLFNVTDPCVQHAVKKLLVAGGRGAGKDIERDLREAVDSIDRALQMIAEDDV